MINSKVNRNLMGNVGTGFPPDNKQSALVKKIALRDVQNDNRSLISNLTDSSPVLGGRPSTDAIKGSGTKRLTPDCPLSPPSNPLIRRNGVNEQHAQRKFESEPTKGSIQEIDKTANCLQLNSKHSFGSQQELPHQQTLKKDSDYYNAPVVRPSYMAPMTFSYGAHFAPISVGMPQHGLTAAESNSMKVNSEVCHSIGLKVSDDEQRKDRFANLQKYLKQCDESNERDYSQMFVNLTPAELSRHAVELEKRAIQLTVEEGLQMYRMKALNILGKSGRANNPLQAIQQPEAKK